MLHLFVYDDYQGKGVARKMWEIAKAECLAKVMMAYLLFIRLLMLKVSIYV
jgi:GNAT superfamily N-acetyltransferase